METWQNFFMPENGTFSLTLERLQNYQFQTTFDWAHRAPFSLNEPAPLGIHANAATRLDEYLQNTCLIDPIGGSASFYDTKVKLIKV